MLWFFLKLMVFLFTYVWLRATLPRLRYDQLMDLGWKLLIPVALGWTLFLATRNIADQNDWDVGTVVVAALIGLVILVACSSLLMVAITKGNEIDHESAEEVT